jgi:Fibronectin type III domain
MPGPGSPTDVQALVSQTSATVSWSASVNTSGLTGYTVTATSSDGGTTCTATTTLTRVDVTNLTENKKYYFTVVANGSPNSSPSAPSLTQKTGLILFTSSMQTEYRSGGDGTDFRAAKQTFDFQNQFRPVTNAYTRFKSHAEYIRYIKGRTLMGNP